jgi:hypothetical protein
VDLQFSDFTILPDGTPLVAMVETLRIRRWFRFVEVSQSVAYLLKAGQWWAKGAPLPKNDPRHAKLCELAQREMVRRSIDAAVA